MNHSHKLLQTMYGCEHPVAFVTGSGSPRVGRVIARHLASLGCKIVLHANTNVALAEQAAAEISDTFDVEVLVTSGPLEKDATAPDLIERCVERFGRLDILINSAAIWKPTPLDEVTADEVRRYFDVNSVGTFLMARAAGNVMVSQDSGGSIVNLGDWATVRPYLDHAAYFPSKGAVEVMTRSLAVELAHKNPNVRVNCVQPGPVLLADDVPESERQKLASSTLTKTVGTPESIAHAVQFLCENHFVNGVCLPVDGGRSIFAPDGLQIGMNTG